jgi:hypothetical protein
MIVFLPWVSPSRTGKAITPTVVVYTIAVAGAATVFVTTFLLKKFKTWFMKKNFRKAVVPLVMLCVLASIFIQSSCSTSSQTPTHALVIAPGDSTPVQSVNKGERPCILERDYPKVASNFRTMYPNAVQTMWLKEGKSLLAYFRRDGKRTMVSYARNGYLNFAVADTDVSDVPPSIVKQINKYYNRYAVFFIREITVTGARVYEFVMKDAREYVTLQVSEDEITEMVRFKRADLNASQRAALP